MLCIEAKFRVVKNNNEKQIIAVQYHTHYFETGDDYIRMLAEKAISLNVGIDIKNIKQMDMIACRISETFENINYPPNLYSEIEHFGNCLGIPDKQLGKFEAWRNIAKDIGDYVTLHKIEDCIGKALATRNRLKEIQRNDYRNTRKTEDVIREHYDRIIKYSHKRYRFPDLKDIYLWYGEAVSTISLMYKLNLLPESEWEQEHEKINEIKTKLHDFLV